MATAKIGPDTNSHKFGLTAPRFWPQRWLAVRTMPQNLINNINIIVWWNQRKLKALIPHVVVFANNQLLVERRIDFAVFFIVLWSYSRKICLNMWHGSSENSDGGSYLLRICFIYRTNASVLQSWISLQVVDREQCVLCTFWFTNKRVQIKLLSILKVVSFESVAGSDFSERGMQG